MSAVPSNCSYQGSLAEAIKGLRQQLLHACDEPSQFKHYYNKAIQAALKSLNFEYTIASFFYDLASICKKTYTTSNIKDAFRNSSMFLLTANIVKKNIQKYYKNTLQDENIELELLCLSISQIEQHIDEVAFKAKAYLSSPTCKKMYKVH